MHTVGLCMANSSSANLENKRRESDKGEDVRSNDDEEMEICFRGSENCFVFVHRNLRKRGLASGTAVTSPFSSLQAFKPSK